jgi:hypothetical protein
MMVQWIARYRKARSRPLWWRVADTADGNRTLAEARRLALHPEYADLTDGQLIRLAYWGAAGESA